MTEPAHTRQRALARAGRDRGRRPPSLAAADIPKWTPAEPPAMNIRGGRMPWLSEWASEEAWLCR